MPRNTSKHTPFPWYHLSGCIVTTKVGPDWADFTVAQAKTEADAELIARVELLLDALRLAYTRIFNHRIDDLRDPEVTEALDRDAQDAIDSAILAATGREHVPCTPGEHEAEIALHRAAPKMLAALLAISDAVAARELAFTKKRQSESGPYHPANVAMVAAIAAATGETP